MYFNNLLTIHIITDKLKINIEPEVQGDYRSPYIGTSGGGVRVYRMPIKKEKYGYETPLRGVKQEQTPSSGPYSPIAKRARIGYGR